MAQSNKERNLKQLQRYYKKHPRKHCPECDAELNNNNQSLCLDCILKHYKYDKRKMKYLSLLSCRGYDKEMIMDEIEKRGI